MARRSSDKQTTPAAEPACRRPPQRSAVADECGPTAHALWRVTRMNKTMMGGRLRSLGLALGQDLLLLQLWDRDNCTQTELVERLGLDPSTVTKMLQRMERDGWLTRAHSSDDGRASVVTLTDAGRRVRGQVTALWRQLERETVAALTPSEREQLMALLRKVEGGLHGVQPALDDRSL